MEQRQDESWSADPTGERLRRALDAFLEVSDGSPEARERVLRANRDIEDLLEPMLDVTDSHGPPSLAAITDDPAGHALMHALLQRLAEAGPRIERYRLVGEIARGGMGVVSEAYDVELGRRIAMKRIRERRESHDRTHADLDPGLLRRFLNEARILGQLDHPGIVPIHELGVDERGRPYFTMPLIEGHDLETVLKLTSEGREGYTVGRVLTLMIKVCETLAYAHSRGVVHRDLKPANIRVGRYGEVYVMDWGLAKLSDEGDVHDLRFAHGDAAHAPLDSNSPLTTVDGTVVGTPAYMAPEQARGDVEHVTHRSDVYSLGAILYQVLAEHPPYDDDPEHPLDARALLARVLHKEPRPIHEHDPRVPNELVAICNQAMARRPHRRYASAEEMAEDLRAYCEDRVVFAHRTGPYAEVRKWIVRNRIPAFLTLLLIVGIALAIHVITTLRGEHASELETLFGENRLMQASYETRLRSAERTTERVMQERDDARTEHARAELRTQREHATAEALRARNTIALAERDERISALEDEARRLANEVVQHERQGAERDSWALQVQERLQSLQTDLSRSARTQLESQHVAERSRELLERMVEAWIRDLVTRADRELWPLFDLDEARTTAWLNAARSLANLRPALVQVCPSLRDDLEAFLDPTEGEAANPRTYLEPSYPGVAARLAKHREWLVTTLESVDASRAWADALMAMARSPRYAGTSVAPIPGFLPLGLDPTTGLMELWFVPSGERPQRKLASGSEKTPYVMTAASGAVFICVPGAEFAMGARPSPSLLSHNRDRNAEASEGPVHDVTLETFLLMKHELTRGQWERLGGTFESHAPTGPEPDGALPVTNVSWDHARRICERHQLDLPTEAQWEFAARADRQTPFWTGTEEGTLRGSEHVRDTRRADEADAHPLPVGSLEPNGFGFHDMLGNVSEWCRDAWLDYKGHPFAPGDALRLGERSSWRVVRGGSYDSLARDARVSRRSPEIPSARHEDLGFRAARTW
ncbi:MAG: SUMF1/EgtB/PvdO family nonheme iron enzyme [Planctomycetes bacterium]|nr:SUMF1/EgtB/PvdO family nonheme iron enzyme [Planctomycetota bacterium]